MDNNISKNIDFLKQNILLWQQNDSNIKKLAHQLRSIRKEQEFLSNDIINIILSYNQTKISFNGNETLNIIEKKSIQPISIELLKGCLMEFFKNKQDANDLLKLIDSKRVVKKKIMLQLKYEE
jgi:hypothetical protein